MFTCFFFGLKIQVSIRFHCLGPIRAGRLDSGDAKPCTALSVAENVPSDEQIATKELPLC